VRRTSPRRGFDPDRRADQRSAPAGRRRCMRTCCERAPSEERRAIRARRIPRRLLRASVLPDTGLLRIGIASSICRRTNAGGGGTLSHVPTDVSERGPERFRARALEVAQARRGRDR
jgi:hypothetical protein